MRTTPSNPTKKKDNQGINLIQNKGVKYDSSHLDHTNKKPRVCATPFSPVHFSSLFYLSLLPSLVLQCQQQTTWIQRLGKRNGSPGWIRGKKKGKEETQVKWSPETLAIGPAMLL